MPILPTAATKTNIISNNIRYSSNSKRRFINGKKQNTTTTKKTVVATAAYATATLDAAATAKEDSSIVKNKTLQQQQLNSSSNCRICNSNIRCSSSIPLRSGLRVTYFYIPSASHEMKSVIFFFVLSREKKERFKSLTIKS